VSEEKKIQVAWVEDEREVLECVEESIKRHGLEDRVNLIPICIEGGGLSFSQALIQIGGLDSEVTVITDGLTGRFGDIIDRARKNAPNRRVCLVSTILLEVPEIECFSKRWIGVREVFEKIITGENK